MINHKRKGMPKPKQQKEVEPNRDRKQKPPLVMPCLHEPTNKLRKEHFRFIDCPVCGKSFKYEPATIWKVKGVKVCSMGCRTKLMKIETM